jgi:hypothetical protein
VAFTNGWKMSLVVLACLPLLIFAAAVQAKYMMASGSKVRYCLLYRQCIGLLYCQCTGQRGASILSCSTLPLLCCTPAAGRACICCCTDLRY